MVSCVNTKTYCSKRSEDKLEGGGSLKVFDSGFAKPQEAVLAELVVVPNLKGDMVNMTRRSFVRQLTAKDGGTDKADLTSKI